MTNRDLIDRLSTVRTHDTYRLLKGLDAIISDLCTVERAWGIFCIDRPWPGSPIAREQTAGGIPLPTDSGRPHFPADHPPPTVLTSEGPKPRRYEPGFYAPQSPKLDLTAEGRPEPDPETFADRWAALDQHDQSISVLKNDRDALVQQVSELNSEVFRLDKLTNTLRIERNEAWPKDRDRDNHVDQHERDIKALSERLEVLESHGEDARVRLNTLNTAQINHDKVLCQFQERLGSLECTRALFIAINDAIRDAVAKFQAENGGK